MVADTSCAKSVKEEMFRTAIRANGVYDTFNFCESYTCNKMHLHLHYMQVSDEEIASISVYGFKFMYFTDEDCFDGAEYIGEQYYDATVLKIKEDLVKSKNAIWSTISVNEFGFGDKRRFEITYRLIKTGDTKKSSETDKMLTESNNSKKHTDSEICDISSVSNREGTTYKISELVTFDKEYLYLPVHFGTVEYPGIFRIKIPLKTLKDALDQVE
jgi:hypothetical protein